MNPRIHIITWECNSSGGFDWYPDRTVADSQWHKEKKYAKSPEGKQTRHRAIYFSINTKYRLTQKDRITSMVELLLHKHSFDFASYCGDEKLTIHERTDKRK